MAMPFSCLDEPTFVNLLLGALPPEHSAAVDEHLDCCVGCRRMVATALRARAIPRSRRWDRPSLRTSSR